MGALGAWWQRPHAQVANSWHRMTGVPPMCTCIGEEGAIIPVQVHESSTLLVQATKPEGAGAPGQQEPAAGSRPSIAMCGAGRRTCPQPHHSLGCGDTANGLSAIWPLRTACKARLDRLPGQQSNAPAGRVQFSGGTST